MEPRIQSITASISELEDRYAELLTLEAPERELAMLWASIRELRIKLEEIKKGVSCP
ncbi:hypothetical protein [Flaviaesturariibacter flavus]|uniref:hypothetical protein n=1 Tax=Flaviaesturariibacter flavus TaxID=2502780 RepID=UPI0014049A0A|nr:hypothetical protein [Flaviaesturariibacter flavus]